MKACLLNTLIRSVQGEVVSTVKTSFSSVGTDTRVDLTDHIFFALVGDQFDAHDFLDQAVQKGAACLVVHRDTPMISRLAPWVTIIKVKDTLKALQEFANYCRLNSSATIVGITGSNGKTTSKEFTATLLSQYKQTHFSKGSFNNHWGVPLTLLSEPEDSEVTIVEMGMNHYGELTSLSRIAVPDIVVCTTVGRAHIEHFGSISNIAKAKEEIYFAAPDKAIRIYNLDNPETLLMHQKALAQYPKAKQIITFSKGNMKADVMMQLEKLKIDELKIKGMIAGVSGNITVPVFGAQNVINLMVAACIGLAVGLKPDEIWEGLKKCKTIWGRNQMIKTETGAKILFDGYNANPDSMRALIDNVNIIKTTGKKIGVFGQMLELGSMSPALHRELGESVGRAGFSQVWFFGQDWESFEKGLMHVGYRSNVLLTEDFEERIAEQIAVGLSSEDIVLVKGSRGMKMERFLRFVHPLEFSEKA